MYFQYDIPILQFQNANILKMTIFTIFYLFEFNGYFYGTFQAIPLLTGKPIWGEA